MEDGALRREIDRCLRMKLAMDVSLLIHGALFGLLWWLLG